MLDLNSLGLITLFFSVFVAPRMALGFILISLGHIFIGISAVMWGFIIMIIKLTSD